MSFLTPFFLLGLAAIAIPVLIHLIQREKKRVIEFPSLMFVRRIPYQSVRRRRIRHWALLLLRAAAIALIVAAFARPFFQQGAVAAAVGGGAREVVILLDQSASMGYGDHWARAQDAARTVVRGLGSRRSRDARALRQERRGEHARDLGPDAPRSGHRRGEGRVGRDALRPGAEAGGQHPEPLADQAARGGADQRLPAQRLERLRGRALPRGHDASARSRSRRPTPSNLAVPSVTFARASFSGQERITVTAGLSNKGDAAGEGRARHADDRRPRDRDRARDRRAARVGLGLLHAVHADRRERARLDQRRLRSAAGRQHVPLRARAERSRCRS